MKTAVTNMTLRGLSVNRYCGSCHLNSCFIAKNFKDEAGLDIISAAKNCLTYEKLGRVVSDNFQEEGLYILNHGKLKLYKTNKNNQEFILRFIAPGEIFSFFKDDHSGENFFSVRALEESAVCFLNKDSLEKIISEYPGFAEPLAKSFYSTLIELQNRYFKATQFNVPAKVADALIIMLEAFGEDQNGVLNVKLSREDIAGLATTTKEQVSKVFSELKEAGIIRSKGKKIEITDLQKLRSAASK